LIESLDVGSTQTVSFLDWRNKIESESDKKSFDEPRLETPEKRVALSGIPGVGMPSIQKEGVWSSKTPGRWLLGDTAERDRRIKAQQKVREKFGRKWEKLDLNAPDWKETAAEIQKILGA
jgi:hypothetical protein